jgi:hypothetical protein
VRTLGHSIAEVRTAVVALWRTAVVALCDDDDADGDVDGVVGTAAVVRNRVEGTYLASGGPIAKTASALRGKNEESSATVEAEGLCRAQGQAGCRWVEKKEEKSLSAVGYRCKSQLP